MNDEEKVAVKDILVFLKIARSLNHVTCRRMIASQKFKKLMEKLKEVCGWDKKDEKSLSDTINNIAEEIETDVVPGDINTLDKKSKRIGKILVAIGGAISAGVGIMYLWHKRKKTNEPSLTNVGRLFSVGAGYELSWKKNSNEV